MENKDNIFIAKYLRNELSEEEKQLFEQRMVSDAKFKEAFLFEKQLFETLDETNWSFVNNDNTTIKAYKDIYKSNDIQKLKKTLSVENKNFQDNLKSANKKWYYAVAAVVFLLFSTTFFLNNHKSNQELYNVYLNKDSLFSSATRGDNKTLLIKAEALFNNNEYHKALIIFNKEFNKKENRTGNLYIYKGISELELNQYDNALATFNQLITSDLLDAEKGYWYKALLYLKNNKITEAKKILHKIINKNLYNHQKAKELIGALN